MELLEFFKNDFDNFEYLSTFTSLMNLATYISVTTLITFMTSHIIWFGLEKLMAFLVLNKIITVTP